ncbi:rCG63043, isoform CRA_a [Rattus norvegicus]|uniref:RCG63043, isoform CRA_a n=1 Tax=Rattus norvegicus TaxID=10116 RepID=A6HWI2_RAT|nr:rCG63043, isoform CRA_a [Rattus norvegicus]
MRSEAEVSDDKMSLGKITECLIRWWLKTPLKNLRKWFPF